MRYPSPWLIRFNFSLGKKNNNKEIFSACLRNSIPIYWCSKFLNSISIWRRAILSLSLPSKFLWRVKSDRRDKERLESERIKVVVYGPTSLAPMNTTKRKRAFPKRKERRCHERHEEVSAHSWQNWYRVVSPCTHAYHSKQLRRDREKTYIRHKLQNNFQPDEYSSTHT